MNELYEAVSRGIVGKRNLSLEEHEESYVKRRLKQVDFKSFKNQPVNKIVFALVDMLVRDLAKLPKKQAEMPIDVHELIKKEVGDTPETYRFKKIDENATVDSLLQKPETLQRVFNPHALRRKAYLVLDRKYQSRESNNINEFQWVVSDTSRSYDAANTVVTGAPIQDIVKIKMFPFRFPSADNAIMDFYNLSVEIKELSTQACVITHNNKRYHFMFDLEKTGVNTYDPYKAVDPGNSVVEFEFLEPIIDLSDITIVFGNPEHIISLDPDVLTGVIAPNGVQTEITFGQPHKCSAGCTVNINGFTTSAPSADKVVIDSINNERGNYVAAVTSNTMLLNIDISALFGAIAGAVLFFKRQTIYAAFRVDLFSRWLILYSKV